MKRPETPQISAIIALICLVLAPVVLTPAAAKTHPAQVQDLSDRTYESAVDFFKADYLNSKTTRVKYIYLIKALLKEEGKTLDSYTRERLAEKYNIGVYTLYRGLREQ